MERGSGFFGQLFSRDSQKKPEPQNQPVDSANAKDQPVLSSRREFLAKAAKIAMGVAVTGTILDSRSALGSEQSTETKDPSKENEKAERKQLHDMMSAMSEFNDDYSREHGDVDDRTLQDQDRLRTKFMMRFKDQLPVYVELVRKYKQLYAIGNLGDADCAGLYYRHLQELGEYKNRPITWKDGNFFAMRAEDFLPTGDEIHPEEIDPRLGKLTDIKTIDLVYDYHAWADPNRRHAFKKLLDEPSFRSLVQKTDCTLAEAYSLIKAAIKQQESSGGSAKDQVTHLLLEREQMKKEVLIGKETDQVIVFNYVPKTQDEAQFDKGHALDEIALSTLKRDGETMEETKKRFRRIESTDEETSGAGKKNALFLLDDAIRESRGKTTIMFNNHGMPGAQYLGETQKMTAKGLAFTLVERMLATRDPNMLKDTKLVFDSCFSYDFTHRLMAEIRGMYEAQPLYDPNDNKAPQQTAQDKFGVPFKDLPLPTVIALTQEGSFGYDSSTKLLAKEKKAIAKEGKLTAGFLMRRIQPEYYPDADMTFFSGKHGKVLEVGVKDNADSATQST